MARTSGLTALLVAAISIAFFLACSEEPSAGEKTIGQGVYIPAHWQETREIDGHRVHVVEKKLACSSCHELTDEAIGPVTPKKCQACHQKEASLRHASEGAHELFGDNVQADCRSCHAFTLHPTDAGPHAVLPGPYEPKDCLRCHASQQGSQAPVLVHRPANCLTCHKPHEQTRPVSAPCEGCHQEVHTTHASAGKTPLETCTTCHQRQHASAETAVEGCATCHATQKPIIPSTALFDHGHEECVACHLPHEFDKQEAQDCRFCHNGKPVLAESSVALHRQCTSCHNPHNVKSASATACTNCHQNIAPNHPKHGTVGTCTGCHDPHPASRGAQVRDCSSCHHEATAEDSFHEGVACRSCHEPHSFVLANTGLAICGKCHAENVQQVTAHRGHRSCTSCHSGLPHRPELFEAPCGTCHKQVAHEVRQGHSECTACHDPHGTKLEKQCADCHAGEQATAPVGHQTCTNCHNQHTGAQRTERCGSCHKEEAQTPHGALSANCANCHRPHGPEGPAQPPTCASCHKSGQLPGLHALQPHNKCQTCHTPHGEVKAPEPAVCRSCHQDRVDHFPEARACSSCHLFTPNR